MAIVYKPSAKSGLGGEVTRMPDSNEEVIRLKTAKVFLTRKVEQLERELIERLEAQRDLRLLGIEESVIQVPEET